MLFKNRRTASSVVLTALTLFAALIPGSAALADSGGAAAAHPSVKVDISVRAADANGPVSRAGAAFAAQARAAGLTAKQADALQAKADKYLAKLGSSATQVAPDKIVLKGAVLFLAVPGEAHPRGLSSAADAQLAASCPYYNFCAYSGEGYTGDPILMEQCYETFYIPWYTTGSWKNNQTPGTQPLLTFTNGSTWLMPGAYAVQSSGVGWSPVSNIVPCRH